MMTEGEAKIPRFKVGFRQVHWLPVLATALMLDRCYIPGGSPWEALGILIWLGLGFMWLVGILPFAKKQAAAVKRPLWPVLHALRT
jgi:hypothetical protein